MSLRGLVDPFKGSGESDPHGLGASLQAPHALPSLMRVVQPTTGEATKAV